MKPTGSRHSQELALTNLLAERDLTSSDFIDYCNVGFTSRILAHTQKIFIVWRYFMDVPAILGHIRILRVSLDTYEGLRILVENQDKDSMWLSHSPKLLFSWPVWANVPVHADISFTPKKNSDKFTLFVPIVFKTKTGPKRLTDGDVYIDPIHSFKAKYPQYNDLII